MGVASHVRIMEDGSFQEKLRVTHDLSFPGAFSGESVNSRVQKENLEPCMFGHTFLRVIHQIVHLRQKYPKKIVWIRKEDFKSAYRRIHLNARTAIKSAVRINIDNTSYILISLRLPFGGSPCPSDFSVVSDVITDAINDLMACKKWDPSIVCSEYVEKIPEKKMLSTVIPFAQA